MIDRLRARIRKPEETSFTASEKVRWNDAKRTEAYLATLDGATRQSVEQFAEFATRLQEQMGDTKIAVLVVGSSTRPESKRHHEVEDIDLRVLNSEVGERENAVNSIQNAVRDYLHYFNIPFEEEDCTIEGRIVDSVLEDGHHEPIEFVDWYNTDPSFLTHPSSGLPLHISISGIDNIPSDQYLSAESDHKTSAVLLV